MENLGNNVQNAFLMKHLGLIRSSQTAAQSPPTSLSSNVAPYADEKGKIGDILVPVIIGGIVTLAGGVLSARHFNPNNIVRINKELEEFVTTFGSENIDKAAIKLNGLIGSKDEGIAANAIYHTVYCHETKESSGFHKDQVSMLGKCLNKLVNMKGTDFERIVYYGEPPNSPVFEKVENILNHTLNLLLRAGNLEGKEVDGLVRYIKKPAFNEETRLQVADDLLTKDADGKLLSMKHLKGLLEGLGGIKRANFRTDPDRLIMGTRINSNNALRLEILGKMAIQKGLKRPIFQRIESGLNDLKDNEKLPVISRLMDTLTDRERPILKKDDGLSAKLLEIMFDKAKSASSFVADEIPGVYKTTKFSLLANIAGIGLRNTHFKPEINDKLAMIKDVKAVFEKTKEVGELGSGDHDIFLSLLKLEKGLQPTK
jgi:hypothetical protein